MGLTQFAIWHPHSPCRGQPIRRQCRVQFGVARREVGSTSLDERSLVGLVALQQKAEPLVDRPAADLGGVVGELGHFLGMVTKECPQHLGHVADATAQRRVGQHVDEGAGRVRNLDARAAAPHRLQADEPGGCHRVQLEAGLAQHGLTLAWARGGHHADRTKELLGQPPVLGGGPAADVARREHRRGDRPGIIQRHVGRFGFDGHRNVGAPANTRQPARTRPDCQSAGSRCRRQPEGGGGLAWRHDGRAVAQQFAQLAARRRTQAGWCHVLHLKRSNVRIGDVSSL